MHRRRARPGAPCRAPWVDADGLLRDEAAATGFKGVYSQMAAATFIVQWPRYLVEYMYRRWDRRCR